MEHKQPKDSSDSKLQSIALCSIRIRSRNLDKFGKLVTSTVFWRYLDFLNEFQWKI